MEQENPYRAPDAALVVEDGAVVLAGRLQRLAAVLIDNIIAMAYAIPLMFAFGTFDYVMRGQEPPYWITLVTGALAFVLFALIQGWFLHTSGQTIGKKLLNIRITDLNGRLLPLGRMLGLRYFPLTVISVIPLVGPLLGLADTLFIFREDRRTLHDMIAGTRVVLAY